MKKYTNEFLLNELKRFYYENNRNPTVDDFDINKDYPSVHTYRNYFGTWNNALNLSGLGTNTNKKYTPEILISELQRYYNEYNKVPKSIDFAYNSNYPSAATYIKYFNSWNDALIIAGLKSNEYINATEEFLLSELQRFYKENNRTPKILDFKNNKEYPSFNQYKKYFKTWNNALKLAELNINKINKLLGKEQCSICKSKYTYGSWHFKDNQRICTKCYNDNNYINGILDSKSSTGIGVITEYVVCNVLDDCINCNTIYGFNYKYDLVSEKYKNINVKSSTLRKHKHSYHWNFRIKECSKVPNNYICIGFNEDRTKILKVWIISNNSVLITQYGIWITNSEVGLRRAKEYEVDATPYNYIYQNLDIHTLPEFRNITSDAIASI